MLGALDGKHIRIRCPAKGGSQFYNYKGYHSIVLLALVDAHYRFLCIQVGSPGAASDSQLWNMSALQDAVMANSIGLPASEPLPSDDRPMPYLIIADNAFALQEWLMKPFVSSPLQEDERIFNYRLIRARRCVENAFGIMANRWGCLLTALRQEPENAEATTLACVALHNKIRTACADDDNLADGEDEEHNVYLAPGEMVPIWMTWIGASMATTSAKRRRDRDFT